MRRRGQLGALLMALSFVAGGCGDKPMTLTEEEEAVIVTYAAHVVSKFNTRQPDGLSHVPLSIYEEEIMEETEQPMEEATETEDTSENSQGGENAGSSASGGAEQVTLSEALGVEGIKAECSGTELKSSYVEPDYYALDAEAGNTFLILHVNLTNETGQAVTCDMLSQKLRFVAEVNGSVRSAARTTILLNDLGTYQGTINAGETVETLLFFEVPAEQVGGVDSLKVTIEKEGTVKESVL